MELQAGKNIVFRCVCIIPLYHIGYIYRTFDGSETTIDITTNKAVDEYYKTGWTYIRYVVDTAREPFLMLDSELCVVAANSAFYQAFLVTELETEKKRVYDLGNGQWNNTQLKKLLEDILPKHTFFKDFEIEHEFPTIGRKVMVLNARIMFKDTQDSNPLIILAIEDATKQKLLEEKLRDYAKQLELKISERTKELEQRVHELEILTANVVDRELKMVELKQELTEEKDKNGTSSK